MSVISASATCGYPGNPTVTSFKIENFYCRLNGHTYTNNTTPDQSAYIIWIGKPQT
jgi:hypothetical protein